MAKKTVSERLKELRKETKFRLNESKKDITIIDIDKRKRKYNKKKMKNFKKFYREYLESLNEDDRDIELFNIDVMYTYPTQRDILDDIKRQKSIDKEKRREYKTILKKHSPKSLAELSEVMKKYNKRDKKLRKKLRKQGFNLFDPIFTVTKIDEKKMIKNLKKISKENEARSDMFLEYIDKMYKGGDMPDCIETLNEKNKEIAESTKDLISSLEKSNLKAGIRIKF